MTRIWFCFCPDVSLRKRRAVIREAIQEWLTKHTITHSSRVGVQVGGDCMTIGPDRIVHIVEFADEK